MFDLNYEDHSSDVHDKFSFVGFPLRGQGAARQPWGSMRLSNIKMHLEKLSGLVQLFMHNTLPNIPSLKSTHKQYPLPVHIASLISSTIPFLPKDDGQLTRY